MKTRYLFKQFFFYAGLGLITIWCLSPVLWFILLSFTETTEANSLFSLPKLSLSNYASILQHDSFPFSVINSLKISITVTLITISLGILTAYALTRPKFRWSHIILFLFLCVSMFPSMATVSPLYLACNYFGIRDSVFALIVPYIVFSLPITIWILSGHFKKVPKELEEAAEIDGCNKLETLFNVLIPAVLPGIGITSIMVFVYAWNEFIFAITLTSTSASRTIPAEISFYSSSFGYQIGDLAAASIISIIPLLIIILWFQKAIISSLTSGAVKE